MPVKWKGAFRRLRIKTKLAMLISLIMAVSFSIALIVQQYAFNMYDAQLYEVSSRLLNLSSTGIENELKRIEPVGLTVIADSRIQESLREMRRKEHTDYERRLLRLDIQNRLIKVAGSEKNLYALQLLDTTGEETVAGDAASFTQAFKNEITDIAIQASGETRWIPPGPNTPSLLAVREIKSFEDTSFSLEHLGILIIRVNLDKIVHDLSGSSLTGNGGLIIADGDQLVYASDPALFGVSVPAGLASHNGYQKLDYQGGMYFASSLQSSNTGWTYIHIIPYDRLFDRIAWLKKWVVFVFAVVFLIGILGGLGFARTITRPIEKLIAAMRTVDKSDLDKLSETSLDISPVQMDEVGLLQRTFKMMLQRIHELITENYGKQLAIREAELKALQAQINPHFLYNTLESINWMAKTAGQQRISAMVESLGYLMRNSISLKKAMVTVGDELELVGHYLTIQAMRFEERLDFRLEVAAEAMGCLIPKLSIQPLVENAIHYALEPKVEPCRIVIRSEELPDSWVLTVLDDGPGVDPELLVKLRNGEAQGRGTGIGIRNIDERIKLTFGDAYGVALEQIPGSGLAVHIRIPK